ncbi:MAG: hypothetical protein M0Z31_01365 [Clostridia bacterium]|nr:hypothetical protein [Clostridia bacterium]
MPKVPKEVTIESYTLRSTFFLGKLESLGFFQLFEDIKKIGAEHGPAYSWENRGEWGIAEDAWEKVLANHIDPLLVFVHPNILLIHPCFLRYYRSIAQLPQKGIQRLSGLSGVEKIEKGRGLIPEEKLPFVLKTVNHR